MLKSPYREPGFKRMTDGLDIFGGDDNVEIKAYHRLGIGIHGEAPDHAIIDVNGRDGRQKELKHIFLAIRYGLQEFFFSHGQNRILTL